MHCVGTTEHQSSSFVTSVTREATEDQSALVSADIKNNLVLI